MISAPTSSPSLPRTATQMPVLGHPARVLRFRGRFGPYLALISLLQSRPQPARGPEACSAGRERKWEAGRPLTSERRLPGAGERPPRERAGGVGSHWAAAGGSDGGGLETLRPGWDGGRWRGWEWGRAKVLSSDGRTRARKHCCGSRAPGQGTHSGFVINALGSPRAAQLSSL